MNRYVYLDLVARHSLPLAGGDESVKHQIVVSHIVVCPSQEGMNRHSFAERLLSSSLPLAGGDESTYYKEFGGYDPSAPRRRG